METQMTKLEAQKHLNWINVFIDVWSRAYWASDGSEAHQENMLNAFIDYAQKHKLEDDWDDDKSIDNAKKKLENILSE